MYTLIVLPHLLYPYPFLFGINCEVIAVHHSVAVFSLNFSLAGKGPFLTGKPKNMFQTRTLLPGEGLRVHEGFYFRASSQPIDRKVF